MSCKARRLRMPPYKSIMKNACGCRSTVSTDLTTHGRLPGVQVTSCCIQIWQETPPMTSHYSLKVADAHGMRCDGHAQADQWTSPRPSKACFLASKFRKPVQRVQRCIMLPTQYRSRSIGHRRRVVWDQIWLAYIGWFWLGQQFSLPKRLIRSAGHLSIKFYLKPILCTRRPSIATAIDCQLMFPNRSTSTPWWGVNFSNGTDRY